MLVKTTLDVCFDALWTLRVGRCFFILIDGEGWYWQFASLETVLSDANVKRNTHQRRRLPISRKIHS